MNELNEALNVIFGCSILVYLFVARLKEKISLYQFIIGIMVLGIWMEI
jgi:hypothetical protein